MAVCISYAILNSRTQSTRLVMGFNIKPKLSISNWRSLLFPPFSCFRFFLVGLLFINLQIFYVPCSCVRTTFIYRFAFFYYCTRIYRLVVVLVKNTSFAGLFGCCCCCFGCCACYCCCSNVVCHEIWIQQKRTAISLGIKWKFVACHCAYHLFIRLYSKSCHVFGSYINMHIHTV